MTRRKRTQSEAPSVRAVFDPAGDICVRAVAPSGNEYDVKPRAPFQIASKDVDWFFHEWEYQHRVFLSRAEEYQPRRAQFENGTASRTVSRPVAPVMGPEPVVETEPVPEPAVEPAQEPSVALESIVKPKENTEPDSVGADVDGNEEKET